MLFKLRSYILLVIACDVAVPEMFYFMLESDKVDTPDNRGFVNKSITKLVIDLEHLNGIQYVTHFLPKELRDNGQTSVEIRHYDGINQVTHKCPYSKGRHECHKIGRFVVVEFRGGLMQEVSANYWGTSLSHYVGCFSFASDVTKDSIKSLEDCKTFCHEKNKAFFALTGGAICGCSSRLSAFGQATLSSCNEIRNDFELHGGSGVFSVYWSGNLNPNPVQPPWDCIYNLENCPKCPEGMKGINCEIIDCSVNNGNCGSNKCQNFKLPDPKWEFVQFGYCQCDHGLASGTPFCLEPFDECANGSDMCDRSSTVCMDALVRYSCQCSFFYMRVNEVSCEVDFIMVLSAVAAAISVVFCLVFSFGSPGGKSPTA